MAYHWAAETFVRRLSSACHKRLAVRSDGEPSLLAWKTQTVAGLAEGEDQNADNKQVEELYEVELEVDHLMSFWFVEFVGERLSALGADGCSARELRRGRPSKRELVYFSKKMLYLFGVARRRYSLSTSLLRVFIWVVLFARSFKTLQLLVAFRAPVEGGLTRAYLRRAARETMSWCRESVTKLTREGSSDAARSAARLTERKPSSSSWKCSKSLV